MEPPRDKPPDKERDAESGNARQVPPVIPSAPKGPPIPRPPPVPARQPTVLGKPLTFGAQSQSLLTLDELERFKNLLVFAKSIVEGYYSGKHKSPLRGSSAEFADYKEYV